MRTTITTPQLEGTAKMGQWITVGESRIISQDDQAHSIYANMKLSIKMARVVSEKTRSEAQLFLAD